MNVYCVFSKSGALLGTFDTIEKAERYPGPRGMECADKAIVKMSPAVVEIVGSGDRYFTAIKHLWMHEAPEDREKGATWYIAELVGDTWTILFPCTSHIEARRMMSDPSLIMARLSADAKTWGLPGYRESVKATRRTRVRDDKDADTVTTLDSDGHPRFKTKKEMGFDTGAAIAKEVRNGRSVKKVEVEEEEQFDTGVL